MPDISAPNPREIAQLSLSSRLPTSTSVAVDVLRLCQDPLSDLGELVERMSCDPVLASRVLRMANSAAYGQRAEVTSLRGAAMILGLRALRVLALGFTLVDAFPRAGTTGGFDLARFWHRSLVTAVAGRAFATAVRSPHSEEAFVCGLISQIGKLAVAQIVPERYEEAVERGNGWPTEEIEIELLGFASSEVGELMLDGWGLPRSIVVAASYTERLHALPDDSTTEIRELAGLTALAVSAGAVLSDDDGASRVKQIRTQAARSYGLGADTVDELLASLHDRVVETAAAFSLELPPGRTYAQILDEARIELTAVSLGAVVELERTTAALAGLSQEHAELTEENKALQTLALTDWLTGLPNRAALDDALEREIERLRRHPIPGNALGVMMIDVDDFKTFNDTLGHRSGDAILQTVAKAMASSTRGSDLLGRYGGDEFCLLLLDTTPAEISTVAERLRRTVRETAWVDEATGLEARLKISVGTAYSETGETTAAALIDDADAALYRSKADAEHGARPAGRVAAS